MALTARSKRSQYSLDQLIACTEVQPRPYQQRIVAKVVTQFADKGVRSLLIDSPTGSGKTVMGLLAARVLQEQMGLRVGWVAMRRYLLEQVRAENEARRIGVDLTCISMFDRDPPTGFDLLVVDEAQHDAAATMANLHQRVRPRFILGLSATPFRADRVKLCFDTVIKDAGIPTLIRDGYLSPFDHYTIPSYTPHVVVEHYLRDPKRWGRSICYFHTVEQCIEADTLLKAAGVRSAVVTAGGGREELLKDFRTGRLDMLCNCMVLSEGFDCPELQTVFCRPSCRGVTIQMCGRVLRQHPEVPVKQIIQCQRTRWPFVRTAAAATQYVWQQEEWRSLEANPRLDQVAGKTLRALAQIQVTLPKLLQNQEERRDRGWRSRRRSHP